MYELSQKFHGGLRAFHCPNSAVFDWLDKISTRQQKKDKLTNEDSRNRSKTRMLVINVAIPILTVARLE